MRRLPTAPAPGTPVSSSLIRELIDAIRARTLLRGRGYRTRETPNGIVLDIDRVKAAGSGAARPRQCWDYVPPVYDLEAGEIVEPGYFFEPYVYVGTKFYRYAGDVGKDGLANGIVCATVTMTGTIPSIRVGAGFQDIGQVQRAADEAAADAMILLYKVRDWKIIEDYRTIPVVPAWEFGQ